ncbi:cold and drought-regulated protein CORA, partial [Trifolium medium]|nr:cold and drought-regulated protein CORA [Trifolium medium]
MDSKKVILILSLLAMVLLISSVVSARNLTETSFDTKKEQAINVSPQYGKAPYGKSRGDPNNRGGYNPGNGGGGGGSPSNGGGGGGDP